jgi:hypothetical protein
MEAFARTRSIDCFSLLYELSHRQILLVILKRLRFAHPGIDAKGRPAGRLPLDLPLPASLPEREGVLVPELVVLHRPQHAAEAPAQRPPQ